jgi:predicted metal-binding membrane protein
MTIRAEKGPQRALRTEGLSMAAALWLALALLAWAGLAWLAFDMGHPLAQLTMPMSPQWSTANLLAIVAMWAVMMAAMMLPSALPMVQAFVALGRRNGQHGRSRQFVGAYLLVWSIFSVAAAAAQWLLQAVGWVNPMIVSTSALPSGALLLVAGAYQFSPLKRICLARCRTPMGFLVGEWRDGRFGGFDMGWRHGLFCLGCCWALMALLFVGGVMNLAWIAALSIVVAVEKLAPHGERVATLLGLVLLGAGAWRVMPLLQG